MLVITTPFKHTQILTLVSKRHIRSTLLFKQIMFLQLNQQYRFFYSTIIHVLIFSTQYLANKNLILMRLRKIELHHFVKRSSYKHKKLKFSICFGVLFMLPDFLIFFYFLPYFAFLKSFWKSA